MHYITLDYQMKWVCPTAPLVKKEVLLPVT